MTWKPRAEGEMARRRVTRPALALVIVALAASAATTAQAEEDDDGYTLAVGLAEAMLERFAPAQNQILADYIAFPSIAAMHEQHGDDTKACAEWLRANLENNLAMGDARLVDGDFRYPIVVGSTDGPGSKKPGVVIYGALPSATLHFFPEPKPSITTLFGMII